MEPCPRVIIGGTLIDGRGGPPLKDSVVVLRDEWILAVGERGEVEIPEGSEVIDASGKTVLPGFIDSHCHFLSMGVSMIRVVDLTDARSLSEAVERVRIKLGETPKGGWVLGRGWDESNWEERRFITKGDLDGFSPDNPILLSRICGHMITLNSKALEIAGITRETPNPPGGQVDKDERGEPTGVLRDARQLVEHVIPPVTEEMAVEGLRRACDHALSLGCTSVQDAGQDALGVRAYRSAFDRGVLKVRAYVMLRGDVAEKSYDLGIRTGFGNSLLKIGSTKLLIDGSMGARTAALFEPYEDDPSTRGLLMMEPGELNERVRKAHSNGSQAAIHAIGDRGIEHSIDAIQEALRGEPRKDHRHRIEHCEVLTPQQIERLGRLGIVAAMQPNFVGNWSDPGGMYEARLGMSRLRMNNPYRLLLDEGVRVCFGSDGMPFDPLYGVWSAVSHPIKRSRITLLEAIRCYTLESAYASFEEDLKGSVEPGKLADIAILERDLTEVPEEEIKDVPVHMTIVGGKILYYREE